MGIDVEVRGRSPLRSGKDLEENQCGFMAVGALGQKECGI